MPRKHTSACPHQAGNPPLTYIESLVRHFPSPIRNSSQVPDAVEVYRRVHLTTLLLRYYTPLPAYYTPLLPHYTGVPPRACGLARA